MAYHVVNMPSQYECTTGFVYLNSDDMVSEYVEVGDLVYKCLPHTYVRPGTIAMNALQRRLAGKRMVYVTPWILPNNFEIKILKIHVDWLIRDTTKDLPSVLGPVRSHFNRHVLTDGQEILLYIEDNLAQVRVSLPTRGMMTNQTIIDLQVLNPKSC